MSLIEGDAYFPLFSTSEMPIDFAAAGLVPDSPGKFPQFSARRPSFNLSNSQTVPANFNMQNFGPLDEPLFSLFMNGAEKMDINGGFIKGFQIPEELLLQSGVVPELRKQQQQQQQQQQDGMGLMGMDQRQFVQMGILPDPMINGDFNMVPQLNNIKSDRDDKNAARKRKFIPSPPVKCDPHGVPSNDNGQPLTPDEERNMKRQRRLVKNREAAQLFRQRQKAYIQDLEKKVSDLSSTNNEFRARVELLNSENKLIKEQLLYLRNFITQAVSFSFPKSPSSDDSSTPSPPSLLGPLPPGLTLPPELLGAMGNMPGMALGLMGALGSGLSLPGLVNLPSESSNIPPITIPTLNAQGMIVHQAMHRPSPPAQQEQAHSPPPHIETHSIKLPTPTPASVPLAKPPMVNIGAISPVSVPIPSPTPIPTPSPSCAAPQTSMLIPPPTKPLDTSNDGVPVAVVPRFAGATSSAAETVPESPLEVKVKVEGGKQAK